MAMTQLPKPKALRSVTWILVVVARVCAAYIRAAARSTPARSDAVPASTPGLSLRNTSGRWKLSHTEMKWAAFSAAAASMEPASTAGWLATTPTDSPPMRASAQMIDAP